MQKRLIKFTMDFNFLKDVQIKTSLEEYSDVFLNCNYEISCFQYLEFNRLDYVPSNIWDLSNPVMIFRNSQYVSIDEKTKAGVIWDLSDKRNTKKET